MRSTATGWLLLLPTMIVLFVMGVFPFIYVLVISFFDWNAFAADPTLHARFHREGVDLITEVAIPFSRAVLGGSVTLKHLDDSEVEVPIAPGTQPGTPVRLRGLGVPHVERKGRGNLVAVVQVSVPSALNPAQRAAVEQLAAAFGEDT
mgnify:CR=1 FL=1